MPQLLNHLHDPSLDSLQHVHVSLVLGNAELGAAPKHLSKAEQRGAITCSACRHSSAQGTQGAGAHFGHNGPLLVCGQLCVQMDTQGLFWKVLCFGSPWPVLVPEAASCQEQDSALPLLSFIPGQPIYPASQDPSECWHNHLVYQLLPVLYSRCKRKFR